MYDTFKVEKVVILSVFFSLLFFYIFITGPVDCEENG